jgi:hypothetical protein
MASVKESVGFVDEFLTVLLAQNSFPGLLTNLARTQYAPSYREGSTPMPMTPSQELALKRVRDRENDYPDKWVHASRVTVLRSVNVRTLNRLIADGKLEKRSDYDTVYPHFFVRLVQR